MTVGQLWHTRKAFDFLTSGTLEIQESSNCALKTTPVGTLIKLRRKHVDVLNTGTYVPATGCLIKANERSAGLRMGAQGWRA